MSWLGEMHKRMMSQMDCAFENLIDAQARLEHADLTNSDQRESLQESLQAAQRFLVEAKKLASWIDTGECG